MLPQFNAEASLLSNSTYHIYKFTIGDNGNVRILPAQSGTCKSNCVFQARLCKNRCMTNPNPGRCLVYCAYEESDCLDGC